MSAAVLSLPREEVVELGQGCRWWRWSTLVYFVCEVWCEVLVYCVDVKCSGFVLLYLVRVVC